MCLQKYFKTMSAYAESTDLIFKAFKKVPAVTRVILHFICRIVSLAKNYQTELAEKSGMKLATTVQFSVHQQLFRSVSVC
jgi:hypothetical protein